MSGLPNDKVYPSYETIGARTVDNHEDSGVGTNSLGGSVSGTFDILDQFSFRQVASAYNDSFFHDTAGLVTTWNTAGRSYSSSVPAGLRNVAPFTFLSFRVAEINDPLNAGAPISVDVGIRDGASSNQTSTSVIGEIPFPFDHGLTRDKTMLRTLRVPLRCLSIGRQTVDLTRVQEIFFTTGSLGRGAVAYDQLSFSN